MRFVGLALATFFAAGTPWAVAAKKPRHPATKMCGVYAKYACGTALTAVRVKHRVHKVCGVYVKYDC
jgi:hypothetical protein